MKHPKPLGFLCLVKPLDQIKEKGGILLPDYADNVMPDRGTVVAIGPKVTEVKVGDNIFFQRIRVDNFMDRVGNKKEQEYLFVAEEFIIAILD